MAVADALCSSAVSEAPAVQRVQMRKLNPPVIDVFVLLCRSVKQLAGATANTRANQARTTTPHSALLRHKRYIHPVSLLRLATHSYLCSTRDFPQAPFRNMLFYGPPGTGKTMAVRRQEGENHITHYSLVVIIVVRSIGRSDAPNPAFSAAGEADSHGQRVGLCGDDGWRCCPPGVGGAPCSIVFELLITILTLPLHSTFSSLLRTSAVANGFAL